MFATKPSNPTAAEPASTTDQNARPSTTLHVEKIESDLYFAMERVEPDNLNFWKEFVTYQKQVWESNKHNEEYKFPDGSGLAGFESTITCYKNLVGDEKSGSEIWVAYATSEPVKTKTTNEDKPQVLNKKFEMVMTVMTNPVSAFSTHIGITRVNSYVLAKQKTHPGISVTFHSFAARFVRERDPFKTYMITLPMPIMRNILMNQTNIRSWYGDQAFIQWMKTKKDSSKTSANEKEQLEEALVRINCSPILINKDGSLLLHTENGKTIKDKQGKEILEKTNLSYAWFFKHRNLEVFPMKDTDSFDPENLFQFLTIDLESLSKYKP